MRLGDESEIRIGGEVRERILTCITGWMPFTET